MYRFCENWGPIRLIFTILKICWHRVNAVLAVEMYEG